MALEDAIFLSRLCSKVHLIHRRDELRGAKTLQKRVLESDKIEVHWDTVVDAIEGNGRVESLVLTNRKTGDTKRLETDGVFIAVGIEPESNVFSRSIETDRGVSCGRRGRSHFCSRCVRSRGCADQAAASGADSRIRRG